MDACGYGAVLGLWAVTISSEIGIMATLFLLDHVNSRDTHFPRMMCRE